jgi:putative thioredoxin
VAAADSTWVINVDDTDFERAVIERSRNQPVVVDFWAPWCGPCRALGPILERLTAERGGEVVLAKVNVDESPQLAQQFQVRQIPLVIAFRDGRAVLDFEGILPEAQLRLFFDRIAPNETEKAIKQASGLEASQPAEAEALYRRVLAQDRHHEAARLGLARLLLAQGKEDEVTELLSEVGVEGREGAEAERLAGLVFLHQQAKPLGDEAALRRKVEAEPKNAQARYEFGCVVAAAGRYEEALQELLAAAEQNPALAAGKVRPVMVKIFNVIGARNPLADDYRNRLALLLY